MGPGDRAVSLGRPKQPDFTGQSARARRCGRASGSLKRGVGRERRLGLVRPPAPEEEMERA